MSIPGHRIAVRPATWEVNGRRIPVIRIKAGPIFVVVPYDKARAVVDQVHDLCDEYERELREGNPRDY